MEMSLEVDSKDEILKRKVLIAEKEEVRPVASLPLIALEKKDSSSNSNPASSKRIAISGFQPTEMQKLIMAKMKLVWSSNDEYDTLLIGDDVKITHRLLKGLIEGKEILSQTYINNGSGRILTKVFGCFWDDVYKRPRKTIFEGQRIYVSDTLRDYRELVQLVGGTVVQTL